ncbi:hypothetical protein [Aliikangiella sp. IMCC44359]|uniref:hypothetical protein n=1 Tax=Aliikangiella sp. IMCC44359 TaxID=3459125 RepID=UPI00403AAE76
MSDISLRIQLGIILPKLKEKVQEELTTIIEELMELLKQGTLEGEEPVTIDEVKAVIMQNLEIFLDNMVLPPIDKKFNPPLESTASDDSAEGKSE